MIKSASARAASAAMAGTPRRATRSITSIPLASSPAAIDIPMTVVLFIVTLQLFVCYYFRCISVSSVY